MMARFVAKAAVTGGWNVETHSADGESLSDQNAQALALLKIADRLEAIERHLSNIQKQMTD